MLTAGIKAPEFSLIDDQGTIQTLNNFLGKMVILYFYPKDDTPGCTVEACSFRDAFSYLQKQDVLVFGIGKGNLKSHKAFKEKYHLTFPLLDDQNLIMCNKYEVLTEGSMFGKSYKKIMRTTFLINKEGSIEHIWENVNPINHAQEIIRYISKV